MVQTEITDRLEDISNLQNMVLPVIQKQLKGGKNMHQVNREDSEILW